MTQAPDRAVAPRSAVGQVVDPLDLGETVRSFLRTLEGRNASAETIRAYTTSLAQFLAYLAESYPSGLRADEVQQEDVEEYLIALMPRPLCSRRQMISMHADSRSARFGTGPCWSC